MSVALKNPFAKKPDLHEVRMNLVERAGNLIELNDERWIDYCVEHSQIPDNIKAMKGIRTALAKWLWADEWEGK